MKDNDTSISIDNELHSHVGPWVPGSDLDDELVLEDHQGNSHSIPMVLESDAKVRQLTNCEAFKHRGDQVDSKSSFVRFVMSDCVTEQKDKQINCQS